MKKIIAIYVVIAALLLCGCQQKQENTIDCPSCGAVVLYKNYCSVCGKPLSGSNETKPIATEPPVTEPINPQPIVIEPTPTEGLEYTLLDDDTYSVSVGTATDTNIVIPPVYNGKKVTTIGKSAFSGYSRLTSITIPNSITKIDKFAFSTCVKLTRINFNGTVNQWMSIKKGYDWKYYAYNIFAHCSDGKVSEQHETDGLEYTLLSDGTYAVSARNMLFHTDFVIPYQHNGIIVSTIGYSAFNGCTDLTNITIPPSVTTIKGYAFNRCTNLASITIPASVTTIESHAFNRCTNLASITIPAGVTSIGEFAFEGCRNLNRIVVAKNNKNYFSENGVLFNKDKSTLICYPVKKATSAYTIPDSVTSIGKFAFEGCSNLTNITIPDNLESIGEYAFSGCKGLTSITIPDSVTSIGEAAFYGCKGLTSITIPDNVTSIRWGTFYSCKSLANITIPNSVTEIKEEAFWGCTNLTSVTIPDSVTSIGWSVFKNCTNLTNIKFEGTVAQWEAIKKDSYWNDEVPATVVVCTDGEVELV